MKVIKFVFFAAFVFTSCKKKEIESVKTNSTDGTYQEAYSQYISYVCPNNQVIYESIPIYITPQGSTDSKINFNQNKIYAVSGASQSEIGKYTNSYVIFNSSPNDTLFVVSETAVKLITETKHPVPCNDHTTLRYTFEK